MATIRDVAKLAGVSVATVSRVLNQNGYVNPETEQKVSWAIAQLQYEPNAVARGLASKKTGTIALVLPDISNPFFPELSKAVVEVAAKNGFTVILWSTEHQDQQEKSYIQLLKKKYIDGIIFASQTLGKEDIAQMRKNEIPLVVLDRAPTKEHCSIIRSKNIEGAKLAVQHLLDTGCKKIAHIYGPQDLITAKERLIGYEETVKEFSWFSPTLMVSGYFEIEGGRNAVEELLNRHPDIDGIFAGNDLMAIGAMKTLHRKGIRVPDQVAVCGFDGIALSEITEPELTTVAQPIYEMGALATDILIQKIEGRLVEEKTYELDVTLLPRRSTRRETV